MCILSAVNEKVKSHENTKISTLSLCSGAAPLAEFPLPDTPSSSGMERAITIADQINLTALELQESWKLPTLGNLAGN